jgi:SAM-dependent methyltransferase
MQSQHTPDPTERFSDRVDNYIRYRPRYPARLLDTLKGELGLDQSHIVADIGSGTGFLSEMLLKNGNMVYGVEPNREMREAGEKLLRAYPNFQSVDGTAEATTLDDASIDIVTAGQAFHWFDPVAAKNEFRRILAPDGFVAIVWNTRKLESSPFLAEYESLLRRYGTDYDKVSMRHVTASGDDLLERFFAPLGYTRRVFPDHNQYFDYEGLKGRLLSSSYAPNVSDPRSVPMLAELREIFDRHQREGRVTFEYETELYYGRLEPSR